MGYQKLATHPAQLPAVSIDCPDLTEYDHASLAAGAVFWGICDNGKQHSFPWTLVAMGSGARIRKDEVFDDFGFCEFSSKTL